MLDTREASRAGGESGPAVVPGDLAKSLLIAAIKHDDPDLEMPPNKPRLSAGIIADFEKWIRDGAHDPREAAERPGMSLASARKFWAYQKPVKSSAPKVMQTGWPLRELDRHILAELEKHQMRPAPEAAPVTLLRRLHFDLTGLPPTPEQVRAFLKNPTELYEQTVDGLLDSPRFGERWARHWLDVARYAESNGREANLTFPQAWRYRDYVIDAMNADVPYDRFITEQISGDLLPAQGDAEKARLLIATGFLAMGAMGLAEMNPAQFAADVADEQLDTLTRAVLASSIACARCHDHKTDPYRMEDYYALAGIFKSTRTHYGNWIDSENSNHSTLLRLPEVEGQIVANKAVPPARMRQLKEELAQIQRDQIGDDALIKKAKEEGRDIRADYQRLLTRAIGRFWRGGGIKGELEHVNDKGEPLVLCMGVSDGEVRDSQVYDRGELAHPGKTVPRGFPAVFEIKGVPTPSSKQSGRLELARWITSRDHPLTARVMANRVWHHLMGKGLVRTVDNFGTNGEPPSHPELLDHLAITFMDGGWSLKALIKEIVMSATYRQGSGGGAVESARTSEMDPDNRLLSRANARRLDAEVIRDSMLAVSGTLNVPRRQASLVNELPSASVSLVSFNEKLPADLDGSRHRSIYLPVMRDRLPDVLEQFDLANPNIVSGARDITNVPLQALYLLNGSFVREQAGALAERVSTMAVSEEDQVKAAFFLCFNREADDVEIELAGKFFSAARVNAGRMRDAEKTILAAFCQSLLASAEFRIAD